MPELSELIVQFLTGAGNLIITTGSANLQRKYGGPAECPIVDIPLAARMNPHQVVAALAAALVDTTQITRIHLRGHGSYNPQTLGSWDPFSVAALLQYNGLTAARVIAITGCNCARSPAAGDPEDIRDLNDFRTRRTVATKLLSNSRLSFAGEFHQTLCVLGLRDIPVTGRTYSVDIDGAGHKRVAVAPGGVMRSGVVGPAQFSKIVFKWSPGGQTQEWALRQ